MRPRFAGRLVLSAAATLVIGAFSLSASAGGSAGRATVPLLVYGHTGTVSTLDFEKSVDAAFMTPLWADLLMRRSPTGQVLPNLAEKVTQPGRAVYVYHLRRGVKFWDGTELTSADVANSINYARHPTSLDSGQFTSVKSVRATDRYTVVVTLKRPDAGWKYVFTYAGYIFQKKFQDENKTKMGQPGTLIMGTGPYTITSLDPTRGAELSANPSYWRGKPSIQRISVKLFTDEQNEALAFRAGAIDVAWPGNSRSFVATANRKLITAPSSKLAFFAMNTKVPPWNDVHVRRAVAYAINRLDVITAQGLNAKPAFTMIPEAMLRVLASKAQVNSLIKSLPTYRFNLAKARKELAKSAYQNGFSAEIDVFPFVGDWLDGTQAIAGDLARIGINLKVKSITGGAWTKQFESPEGVTLLYVGYDTVTATDPGFIPRRVFHSNQVRAGGQNWGRYSSPTLDHLIEKGAEASRPAERFAVYSKFLRIIASDVPVVPLYTANADLALSSKFTFPTFNGFLNPSVPWILGVKPR